jgi:hypothetical protein
MVQPVALNCNCTGGHFDPRRTQMDRGAARETLREVSEQIGNDLASVALGANYLGDTEPGLRGMYRIEHGTMLVPAPCSFQHQISFATEIRDRNPRPRFATEIRDQACPVTSRTTKSRRRVRGSGGRGHRSWPRSRSHRALVRFPGLFPDLFPDPFPDPFPELFPELFPDPFLARPTVYLEQLSLSEKFVRRRCRLGRGSSWGRHRGGRE